MRWFVGSAVTVLLLWGGYTASPYWALWDFTSALARQDMNAVARRVNFRALRISLAKQLVSEGARTGANSLGEADTQLLASAVAVAADPFLEQFVTPEGLRRLVQELRPETLRARRERGRMRMGADALRTIYETVKGARWRGFRNVYFALRSGDEENADLRIQVRLSRLTWRVVSIELPAAARQRLFERLLQRHAPSRPAGG